MFLVSSYPLVYELESIFSLPAKSTKFNLLFLVLPSNSFYSKLNVNTVCDLLLRSFILVALTERCIVPTESQPKISSGSLTYFSSNPSTTQP